MRTRLHVLSVVNTDNLISKQSFPGCPSAPTHRIASAQRMVGLLAQKTPGPSFLTLWRFRVVWNHIPG